jgi:predicted DNA-binding transcriptional regulator YafY
MVAFDEIEDSELEIAALDMSSYIRGLLNEYSRLPKYNRQEIVFKREIELINNACEEYNILCFRYDENIYKVFAYWHLYDWAGDNSDYLVAYDIETKEISCFFIEKIVNPYLLNKKYNPSQRLLDALQDYVENEEYDLDSVVNFEE